MKALILSGGSGTRLRPLTFSQQKQLIPIANKPVLFYAIEDVIEAGADEIGIILGPNKEQVIDTVESQSWDVPIHFIYQGDPKGIAHTILLTEEFLDDDSIIHLLFCPESGKSSSHYQFIDRCPSQSRQEASNMGPIGNPT